MKKLQKKRLIHLDNNTLKKISILRGVKKNHNMGKYPDEMIHHICEALWNVNIKHMLKDHHTECKLKSYCTLFGKIKQKKISN